MTDDLIARLRAGLDEDERVARPALDAPPDPGATLDLPPTGPWATFDARHDPARVLRWVKAAREILALHAADASPPPSPGALYCGGCPTPAWGDATPWPCPTVRALASVYGDEAG